MTSKLQVTLPKAVAKQYGIEPGDEIEFQPAGGQILILKRQEQQGAPSIEEQLLLFDNATARIEAAGKSYESITPKGRDWTREDLYERGIPD